MSRTTQRQPWPHGRRPTRPHVLASETASAVAARLERTAAEAATALEARADRMAGAVEARANEMNATSISKAFADGIAVGLARGRLQQEEGASK